MADKRLQMPTSCAQVVLKFDDLDQPCENVLYVEHQHRAAIIDTPTASPFDSNAADYVAGVVKTWLTDHWSPIAHNLVEASEVEVIWNTAVGAGPLNGKVYADSDYPIVGSGEGAGLPNSATIAIEWRTALLGRSFHGRSFHIGLLESALNTDNPNRLKPTALTGIPAAYDALRSALTAYEFSDLGVPTAINDRFPLVVMSYVTAGVARTPALPTVITSATLSDPFVDSMRRRLPGHNRHR